MTASPSTVGSVATRMSSMRPAAAAFERDPPVLRLAPLGDVELREHLEAGRHAGGQPLRNVVGNVEDAVDPVADDEIVLLRLDVDVARPVLGGLEDHRVDEADERRVGDAVVGLEVVDVLLVFLRAGDLLGDRRVHRLGRAREAAQLGEDVALRRDVELHRQARREPQLVEPAHVLRVGDRHLEPAAVRGEGDRDDAVEHRQRDHLHRLGVDAGNGEVDERQVVLLGERPRDERPRAPRRPAPVRTSRRPCCAATCSSGSSPSRMMRRGRRGRAPSSRSPPRRISG